MSWEDGITDQLLLDGKEERTPTNLAGRFVVPPLSVLDTRQGYWKERKRSWLSIGLEGEGGRGDALTFGSGLGRKPGDETMLRTSIFDPVLTEIAYRWFCPPNGRILDPFAGGATRGIVAAALGRSYIGLDLSAEQIAANRAQAGRIFGPGGFDFGAPVVSPRWIEGDATQLGQLVEEPVDFIFTCPPYADLEVYGNDARDLSRMGLPRFRAALRFIAAQAVEALRDNRFAAVVMGEARGADGGYHGLVAETVSAFADAGARFYNNAILLGAVGSAALRAGKQFETSRKLPLVHHHVLVFVKGDERLATEAVLRKAAQS